MNQVALILNVKRKVELVTRLQGQNMNKFSWSQLTESSQFDTLLKMFQCCLLNDPKNLFRELTKLRRIKCEFMRTDHNFNVLKLKLFRSSQVVLLSDFFVLVSQWLKASRRGVEDKFIPRWCRKIAFRHFCLSMLRWFVVFSVIYNVNNFHHHLFSMEQQRNFRIVRRSLESSQWQKFIISTWFR